MRERAKVYALILLDFGSAALRALAVLLVATNIFTCYAISLDGGPVTAWWSAGMALIGNDTTLRGAIMTSEDSIPPWVWGDSNWLHLALLALFFLLVVVNTV